MIPTAPVKKNIFLVAFALGILIPIVIVFMRENMNTRVRGRKDLEGLSVPFIGEIPLSIRGKKRVKSHEEHTIVVKEGSRDIMNEAFRAYQSGIHDWQRSILQCDCSYLVQSGQWKIVLAHEHSHESCHQK